MPHDMSQGNLALIDIQNGERDEETLGDDIAALFVNALDALGIG